MRLILATLASGLALATAMYGAQGRGQQSPASQRPPQTVNPQTYTAEQIRTGEARFASQCGFCHGRDANGSDTGPDLTRSTVVAEDLRGDKIGAVVRAGRLDKGMPAFDMNDFEIVTLAAFIHDQKAKAEAVAGGRRSVDVSDLQTGNADAGRQYFNGAGACAKCHSATGDLAGIGSRFQGLPLLQRFLYPTSGRPAPAPAKVTATLPSGETVTGSIVSRDEFTIVMTDAAGAKRTLQTRDIKYTIDDPLAAHWEQLGKYTDNDMHNVFAYLQTLR
jgi:cytochrome c oxidase cbb3-type subunit 3